LENICKYNIRLYMIYINLKKKHEVCLFNQPSMCFCIRKLTANFLAKRVFKRCLDMFGPHFLHALRWIIVMRWCNKLLASHEPVYIYIILYICTVLIGDDCIQNT
jgi:hypothetical protein